MSEAEQDAVAFSVGLLRSEGPSLRFPLADRIYDNYLNEIREENNG